MVGLVPAAAYLAEVGRLVAGRGLSCATVSYISCAARATAHGACAASRGSEQRLSYPVGGPVAFRDRPDVDNDGQARARPGPR